MNILGIQAFYYSHAAAMLADGELKFFIENEKVKRIKGERDGFPIEALRSGLKYLNLKLDDIEEIVFPKSPLRFTRSVITEGLRSVADSLLTIGRGNPEPFSLIPDRVLISLAGMPYFLPNLIKQNIRFSGLTGRMPKITFVPHHLAHAASAFYASGLERATIVIVDGVGETESTSIWKGNGLTLEKLEEIPFPNSLGEFYAAFTEFCGFKTYQEEGKLMGLAAYGNKDDGIDEKMKRVIRIAPEGYQVNSQYTIRGSHSHKAGFSDELVALFGPPRKANEEISQYHKDVAYAAQSHLEMATARIVARAVRLTGIRDLCLSGGVAMNCKLNGAVEQSGLVETLFVFPASNDAGAAVGAAMVRAVQAGGDPRFKLEHAYFGMDYSDQEIEATLKFSKVPYRKVDLNELSEVVGMLLEKRVVGLFTTKNEFGARALGARSILANPTVREMSDIVNAKVKRREPWRPFAPVILEGFEPEYFVNGKTSRYMMKAYTVREDKAHRIPAVVHVDKTCRPQSINRTTNPVYYDLVKGFYDKTGVPILLNTSFNVRGEPIVSQPVDALRCYLSTGMDGLLIGSFLLRKDL